MVRCMGTCLPTLLGVSYPLLAIKFENTAPETNRRFTLSPEFEKLIRGNPIPAHFNLRSTNPSSSSTLARNTRSSSRAASANKMFSPSCCPALPSSTKSRAIRRSASCCPGRPWSVYDKDAPPADARVFELGVPVLGICYGLQFMVHTLGGRCVRRRSASTATPKSM